MLPVNLNNVYCEKKKDAVGINDKKSTGNINDSWLLNGRGILNTVYLVSFKVMYNLVNHLIFVL